MDVVLPKVALTMTEAVLVEWLVEEGGEVAKGQPLFTIETDKTATEIESPGDGVLREVRVAAGETVQAGAVIATLVVDGQQAATPREQAAVTVAPAAAALAEALGVDLATVRGSGTAGRVLEVDVMAAADATPAPAAVATEQGPRTEPLAFSRARAAGMRLTEHSVAVPTFLLGGTLRFPEGATPTDSLAVAAAAALKAVPVANACVRDGQPQRYLDVRIGVLVRDGDALLPLVFDDPSGLTAEGFREQRSSVGDALARGPLPLARTSGATFVISNLGRYDVEFFTAVLYPGTAITLALGTVGADRTAQAVLTCDHRLVDGVDAAEFLTALRTQLREEAR